jgi:hypothetical protein
MRDLFLMGILLSACSADGAPEAADENGAPATEEAAATRQAPVIESSDAVFTRAVVEHYCTFMTEHPLAGSNVGAGRGAQRLLAERLSDAAETAGVDDWADFEAWQASVPPGERQRRLEEYIQEFELQKECLMVRDPSVMTKAEQKAFMRRRARLGLSGR